MDIKLKKSKLYSNKTKCCAVIVIIICTLMSCLSIMSLFGLKSATGMSPLSYDKYFETEAFNNQYSQLVRDVVNVNLAYKDEEYIRNGYALGGESLIRNFILDYNIDENMFEVYSNEKLMKNMYYKYVPSVNYNVDQESFDEYMKLYEEYFPGYKIKIIQEQLSDYKTSKNELDSYKNFGYYMVNSRTGEVISNMELSDIKKQSIQTTIDGPYIDGHNISNSNYYYYYDSVYEGELREATYYYNNYLDSVEQILQDNDSTLYVCIKSPLVSGDNIYEQNELFKEKRQTVPVVAGIAASSVLVAFLMLIYLIMVSGRNSKYGEVNLLAVDKVYNDIQTFFVVVVAFLSLPLGYSLFEELYYMGNRGGNGIWLYMIQMFLYGLVLFDVMIGLSYLTSMARQMKAKQIFKNTLVAALFRKIGNLFGGKTFKGWLVFCMFIYAVINMFLYNFFISSYNGFSVIIAVAALIVFNLISAGIFIKALSSLTSIMVAVKETSKGNLNYTLDMDEISPSFTSFATDVEGMQIGLKKAVEEAVKGERMKTDLITNVSHDLKTPLTSIITYVDLLKKEEIQNESAKGYVNILDEKANRLKQLIEDLIEASKASSGNLSVSFEKVDLRQLVMQASGEFEEKIKMAGLNFRISSSGETAVSADGKHMWRIVENFLSNTIKYSMPNSRVYIDIIKTNSMGVMIIKNMSAQPIEVLPDQLTERFVRGDESRTTDGSGLGLSIAKSLTELQKGSMDISIDGDLFKVSIKMPLWEEIKLPIEMEKSEQIKRENSFIKEDNKPLEQ